MSGLSSSTPGGSVSSGGSASPAPAPPPPGVVDQLLATIRRDLDAATQRLTALEAQIPAGGLAGLTDAVNTRVDKLVAAVQPLERLAGLPDIAGEFETRLKGLETSVEGIVEQHLPTLAALFGVVSRDHPHDSIPPPGTTPPPVVLAPVGNANVRRLG